MATRVMLLLRFLLSSGFLASASLPSGLGPDGGWLKEGHIGGLNVAEAKDCCPLS